MKVLMFQPRFAPLVEKGLKLQTIRPPRKRPIRVGELLSLREWTGRPYRSKHRELRRTRCLAVKTVSLGHIWDLGHPWDLGNDGMSLEGIELDIAGRARLARADGFACATEMLEWFEAVHGLPFQGTLIRWSMEGDDA